jgi:tetratricopeptide (TPR) repeat protein
MPRSTAWTVVLLSATSSALAAQPTPARQADSLFFLGDWARAKAGYDEYLTTNPKAAAVLVRAGLATLRLGKPDDAIGYFQKVIELAPAGRAPLATAGIGMAHALKGDRSRAFTELDKAVAAGWGNVEVLDHDEVFASLRDDSRFKELRERANQTQLPCLADSRWRAFDFWIGEWDAYVNGSTQLAGRSRIERISGGCAILENWTSNSALHVAAGYEGKSINFIDPGSSKWRQVWSGSARDVGNFDDGVYADGAMRFYYHKANAQGQPVEGHFIFYNLGPNRVRQFQDQSTDGGKTFQTVYDFIYLRRGSGETAPVRAGY